MKQIALTLGLMVALVMTVPIWGGPTSSAVEWTFTRKPAACFATESVSLGGLRLSSSCAQWRYCSPDDAENLAKGYTCAPHG